MGAILRRIGVEFEAVFSSPLVRARETAEVTLEICQPDHDLRIEFTDRLLNSASADAFAQWLKQLPDKPNVLLVGHAPSIEERVRGLLSITRAEALSLSKGSVACVETTDRRTGSLRFFITPQMLGI